LGIAAAALTGMVLVAFSTRWGPGVGGDATIYMASAGNLLAGKGLGLIEADDTFRLLPYSAPFLPLTLAGLKALGLEMTAAARWLNILLFGGLIALAGRSSLVVTKSISLSVISAFLLAASPILTPVYSWAMAEPLTLLTGFGGLWLMSRQIKHPGSLWPLFLAAMLAGLAALSRYSGTAFAAAAGLGWLILAKSAWREKIGRGLIFGITAALPSLAWVLVQLSHTSGVASRSIESAAGMAGRLAAFWPQFGEVLLSWLLPVSWIDAPFYPRLINLILTWGLAILMVGMIVYFLRRGKEKEINHLYRKKWPALVSLFILVYAGVIFFTYLTTNPPITLDNRMFSPVHVGALMLLPVFLHDFFRNRMNSILRFAPPALILALTMWYGWRDARIVQQNYRDGLGYNSTVWRSSELIEWVRQTPPETKLVANETMAVLYLTGRAAYPLVEIYADAPQDLNAPYGSSADDPGQALFARSEAALVLFDSIAAQFESIYGGRTPERIEALTTGLNEVIRGNDGKVYYAP
jgi:hypothetical protein